MRSVTSLPRPHHGRFARLVAGALLGCALGGTIATRATAADAPPDKSVLDARQKFRQAISLQTGGNWAAALALFRDVAGVKNTPQVRFNIAICEENLGQLVLALGDYELAASQAREEGSADVAAEVEGRLATLQGRIPKVVLQRDEHASRAKISIDGVEVGATMIGKSLPLDPGSHLVEAEAKGFHKFEQSFDVTEKQTVTVQVAMVAAPADAAGAASAAGGAPADTGAAPAKGPNVLPYVVGGIGVAGLVASGVFFGLRQSAISKLDAACPTRTNCPSSLESTASSGRTDTALAFVGLGVGVVGLGAGAALFFLAPSEKKSGDTAIRLAPAAPLADVGASLIGRF